MVYDKTDMTRRLASDEWLQVGGIAVLAGVARGTLNAWLVEGKITMRYRKTLGGQRSFHPDDVRALLAKIGEVHGEQPLPIPPDVEPAP